jgi:hypothetical protein
VSPSGNPALTNCFFVARNSLGVPVAGITFIFTLADAQATTDAWSQATVLTAVSNVAGLVQMALPVNQLWRINGPDQRFVFFRTGSGGTFALPPYTGSF